MGASPVGLAPDEPAPDEPAPDELELVDPVRDNTSSSIAATAT